MHVVFWMSSASWSVMQMFFCFENIQSDRLALEPACEKQRVSEWRASKWIRNINDHWCHFYQAHHRLWPFCYVSLQLIKSNTPGLLLSSAVVVMGVWSSLCQIGWFRLQASIHDTEDTCPPVFMPCRSTLHGMLSNQPVCFHDSTLASTRQTFHDWGEVD